MTFLACLSFSSETHTHNQICTLPLFLQTIVRRSYSQVFIKGVCYLLSHVQLFITSWTVAHQAPPSMGFPRQEYWSGYLFPSPGDLPDSTIEPTSPALQADSLPTESQRSLGEWNRVLSSLKVLHKLASLQNLRVWDWERPGLLDK